MLSFRKLLWQIIRWYIPSPLLAGKSSTIPGPQTANQKEHPKHEHFGGGGASVCVWRWAAQSETGMDQYLLIPFLGGWTSIYQLFWCSPGVQGFDTLPNRSCLDGSKSTRMFFADFGDGLWHWIYPDLPCKQAMESCPFIVDFPLETCRKIMHIMRNDGADIYSQQNKLAI